METIQSILSKINQIAHSSEPITAIEKDLMLQYTRSLYENIQEIIPESIEKEVVEGLDTERNNINTDEYFTEQSNITNSTSSEDKEPVSLDFFEDASIDENYVPDDTNNHFSKEIEEITFEEESKPFGDNKENIFDEYPSNIITEPEEPLASTSEEVNQESTTELPQQMETISPKSIAEELKATKNILEFKLWNKDIRSYIGINDKYNFISELFGNNVEAYDEILEELNHCENKANALQFLENSGITTLYKWDMEGFSAQVFYNVLSQFFATR